MARHYFQQHRDNLPGIKSELLCVPQEHALGCAVACVASRCGLAYEKALQLFAEPTHAWVRGYYCSEVIEALGRAGLHYEFSPFEPAWHSPLLDRPGTLVFVEPSPRLPAGHYLLRTPTGWMNPWANFPLMKEVEARIEPELPGSVSFVIFES